MIQPKRILAAFLTTIIFLFTAAYAHPPEDKLRGVQVMPEQIDFKLIKAGKKGAQIVRFTNKTQKAITIKSAKKIKAPFSLEATSFPKTVDAGKAVDVKLIFAPTKPRDYKGPIAVRLTSAGELMIVDVK